MTGRYGVAVLCLWVLCVTMVIGQVQAKTEELKGFKDWMIYKQETAKGRICFMSSVPKELRGDYDRADIGRYVRGRAELRHAVALPHALEVEAR